MNLGNSLGKDFGYGNPGYNLGKNLRILDSRILVTILVRKVGTGMLVTIFVTI